MNNETAIRLAAFLSIFFLITLLERFFPKRSLFHTNRWSHNLGLVAINTAMLRLLVPITAASVAIWATNNQIGLLQLVNLPKWTVIIISIIMMDLIIYAQHVLFHYTPLLWRFHAVHHSDLDYDLTTGLRFHTFEIVLSLGIKMIAIILIGVPFKAVIIFEVILNGMALFNHGNYRIHKPLDRLLRILVVTPDLHRVHHSIRREETNSNFGFNVSLWDRIFKTYRADTIDDQKIMPIGLDTHRDPNKTQRIWGMLLQPFKK